MGQITFSALLIKLIKTCFNLLLSLKKITDSGSTSHSNFNSMFLNWAYKKNKAFISEMSSSNLNLFNIKENLFSLILEKSRISSINASSNYLLYYII